MNQLNPYLARTQNWCFALRLAMGYPRYAPPSHSVAWCSSGPRDVVEAMQLTDLAADIGRDLVHVAFALDGEESLEVSLAVRRDAGIEWLPNCRLYAATENARIELLTSDARWFIGSRHVLTRANLPPMARRELGKELAWRRWRQRATEMAGLELPGSAWVPQGGEFANAIPYEQLEIRV